MFLDLWITSEVGNLVLIYMRSFFKDSYFATATAVIINVHFSITCLPLSYSSPSTTLCIITVTHRKSEGGDRMCVWANRGARARVCVWAACVVNVCKLTNLCLFVCLCKIWCTCACILRVCLLTRANLRASAWMCVCVCAIVGSVRGGFGVGVVSSVHQKLKLVRLPYFLMEPPDVIAANPHHVIWLNSTVHNPFSHLTNQINQSLSTTTAFPLRHPLLHTTSAPCDVLHW